MENMAKKQMRTFKLKVETNYRKGHYVGLVFWSTFTVCSKAVEFVLSIQTDVDHWKQNIITNLALLSINIHHHYFTNVYNLIIANFGQNVYKNV